MLGEIFLTFFVDVSVMFTFIHFFNRWHPFAYCIERREVICWRCLLPFTVTALLVMQYPFQLTGGYQADLRAVPIAMAGYIGGPVVGFLVGLIVSVYRIISSGMVIKSLFVYLLIGPTAYLFRKLLPWETFSLWHILALSAMATLYMKLCGFWLPEETRLELYNPQLIAIRAILCFVGMYALAYTIRSQVEETRTIVTLNEKASQDSLTGLLNHGAFTRQANHILRSRGKSAGVFMLGDLDYFKQINDQCGHLFGDNVLRFIAQILHENLRSEDIVGRLGGEEFGILLPNISLDSAVCIARRIQERTSEYKGREREDAGQSVTMSIGITVFQPNVNVTFETIFRQADEALYRAKDTGRNRIEIYKQ
jgi:diguanylate cyclase